MSLKIKDLKRFLIAGTVTVVIIIVVLIFIISKIVGVVNGKQEQKSSSSGSEPTISAKKESGEIANIQINPVAEDGKVNETIQILVNKNNLLPENYVPSDLVVVPLRGIRETQMRAEASQALTHLFDAADKDAVELYCCSGYRSYGEQVELYNWNVETYGEKEASLVSARAGESEHQTGLTMDVTSNSVNYDLVENFGEMPEGLWLAKNAHKYGFIIRFPENKTDVTGYSYEPWHVRFVGVDTATEVYENGQAYEEYLFANKKN